MASKKTPTGLIFEDKSKLVNGFANYTAKETAKAFAESQETLKQTIYKHMEKTEWSAVEMKKFERDVQLYNEINLQLDALGQKTEKILSSNLEIMVKDSVLNDAYFIEQFSKVPAKLEVLNKDVIKSIAHNPWYGSTYSDNIWKNTTQLKYVIKDQLMQSMILGESPSKLARRINNQMGKGAYNATRLARTEMIAANGRAQKEFAKENADIISGMKWVASIDNRTSAECLAHNGEVMTEEEWDSSDHQIPCHPNCRCTYVMEVADKYKISKEVQPFDEWVKEKKEQGLITDGEGYMKPKTPSAGTVKLTDPRAIGSDYTKAFEAKVNSFTKVKDVQSYMQEEFPNWNINLGRMDIESARRTTTAMVEMADKYGYVSNGYIHSFGSFTHFKNLGGNPPNSKYCNAFYCNLPSIGSNSTRNGIFFNSKNWEEVVKRHERSVASSWLVPTKDPGKSVIYHEFGHSVVNYIRLENKEVYDALNKEWNAFSILSMDEKKSKLSQYGASSFGEFCAEAFCEYLGADKPRDVAIRVGSIIAKTAK